MKIKKIGIITTLDHNIGDDFVREGIVKLLKQALPSGFETVNINKHEPLSVYPISHPLGQIGQITKKMTRGKRKIESISEEFLHKFGKSKFDHVDLIVQSGAPCFFDGCATTEWSTKIWEHIVGRLHNNIPVLNIAAGTAYSWKTKPMKVSELKEDDSRFIKQTAKYCDLITVRDGLAQELCQQMNIKSSLLPCTAFLSGGETLINSEVNSPILVNYMDIGGHYQYDQGISPDIWRDTLRSAISKLGKRHEIVFLCHNAKEYRSAQIYFPLHKKLFPKSIGDYYSAISNSKAGIFNRMHASVALAGIGGGSLGIGNDTRMLMLEEIGIKSSFVVGISADEIEFEIEGIINRRVDYFERFIEKKRNTSEAYLKLIRNTL